MSITKNAQIRYRILDNCFSDFMHKYTIDDLLVKVNDTYMEMFGTTISLRQLRVDISNMRDSKYFNAPIKAYPLIGHKCYYQYETEGFSIYNNVLTAEELGSLRKTIDLLRKFRGLDQYAWLEDVLTNLELRFGIKPNSESVVSFDQIGQLKGLEFLGELIDAALDKKALKLVYRPFTGLERSTIIHPYHVKQYNNRWFLIGLQECEGKRYITNKALDRIVSVVPANVAYIPNTDLDFETYFKDVVGVTIPEDHPYPEEVVLKFDEHRFPYVVNKPIHPSQEVCDEKECLIKLFVRPNKELESLIFSFGNQVEVIAPLWLRTQVAEKIELLLKKYAILKVDCTVGL